MNTALLNVSELKVYYTSQGLYKASQEKKLLPNFSRRVVKAVDGISFSVEKGETIGLVGESGCGKSTAGKAIVGLLEPTSGSIMLGDKKLIANAAKDRLKLSKKVQIIFQDSSVSLDPRFTIGKTIGEPLIVHKAASRNEIKERIYKLMDDAGLRPEHFRRFPHELSGGQRQRVLVARALALNPELIVCDEPVSALDVSVQAQVLNLLCKLQDDYGLTYVFISHNLSVVKHICDTVAVMYLGHIVEFAKKEELFANPVHPYTKALIKSIPVPNPKVDSLREMLEGDVPSPSNPPTGCVFHTRCKQAKKECAEVLPLLKDYGGGHMAACLMV